MQKKAMAICHMVLTSRFLDRHHGRALVGGSQERLLIYQYMIVLIN